MKVELQKNLSLFNLFFSIQKILIQTHTKMISRLASISRRTLFTPLTRSVATRIDGKAIGDDICKEIALEVPALEKELGRKPGLAVVIVGGRKDSQTYVKMKEKKANECGFKSVKQDLPEDTTEDTLLGLVSELNRDPTIDGILVQLPLPDHIDQKTVLEAISIGKDVDGFHPHNVGALVRCGESLRQRREAFHGIANAPCTPLGCLELVDRVGIDLNGKHVVILGRSNIVGLPAAIMCLHKNATVVMCHSRTKDIQAECLRADVIIAAIGQPEFVKGDWIKEGATIIDVGVNFKDDPSRKSGQRMCGDVDYKAAREVAGAITPVPGGVGPMTIAMLMKNTLVNAKLALNQKVEGGQDAKGNWVIGPRSSLFEPQ